MPKRSDTLNNLLCCIIQREEIVLSCTGSLQVNFLDEDTEVLAGSCGISRHVTGSPAIGMTCPRTPGLVTDADQSALWDLSLMSQVQVN